MAQSDNNIQEGLTCLFEKVEEKIDSLYSNDGNGIDGLITKIVAEHKVFQKEFITPSKWGELKEDTSGNAYNKNHYIGVYLFLYPVKNTQEASNFRETVLEKYSDKAEEAAESNGKERKIPKENTKHEEEIVEIEEEKYVILYVGRSYSKLQSRVREHVWNKIDSSTYSLKLKHLLPEYLKEIKILMLYQKKDFFEEKKFEKLKYDALVTKLEKHLHDNYPPLLGTSR